MTTKLAHSSGWVRIRRVRRIRCRTYSPQTVGVLLSGKGPRYLENTGKFRYYVPSAHRLAGSGSIGLGGDRAVVRLGDEEGALALRGRNGPSPGLGLAQRECREDLLLVAFDAL